MSRKGFGGISTLRARFLYSEPEVVTQRGTEKSRSFSEEFLELSVRFASVESLCSSVFLLAEGGLSRLGDWDMKTKRKIPQSPNPGPISMAEIINLWC